MGGDGAAMMESAGGCTPAHFVVPMFATVNSNGTTVSSYHTASDQAHTVLGVLLLCMVLSWAAFVMEAVRLRMASRLSGACQLAMGVYLFSWLFFLMHPQDVGSLWLYSTRDMLQLQHCAIAALLCAGGIIELLQSSCLLPPMSSGGGRAGAYWHVLWSSNLIVTGMVFMLHPQHTYAATIKHLLLGSSLILGAPLFIHAKALAWKAEMAVAAAEAQAAATASASMHGGTDDSLPSASNLHRRAYHVEWSMVVAGGSFALAACILLAFRETETVGPHIGTTSHCQPAFMVVVMAYVLSSTTATAALVVATRLHCINQRKRRGATGRAASPASAATASDSDSDASGCVDCMRRRWEHVRASRFRMLWSEEEEQQQMVGLGRQRQQQRSSTCPRAASLSVSPLHLHVSPHSSPSPGADEQLELSASSSGHSRLPSSSSAPSARVLPAPPSPPPAPVEYDEYEEEQWREMQRERRRHEEYTGEEDDDDRV